jgi:hypothetical protein
MCNIFQNGKHCWQCGITYVKYGYMLYQETTDNRVLMIRLNPVTTGKDCVNRGMFSTDNNLYNQLTHRNIKKILLTNDTMDDREYDVAIYFEVQKQWNELLYQWKEEEKSLLVLNGITSYYFLSKQQVKWTIYGLVSSRVCITIMQ